MCLAGFDFNLLFSVIILELQNNVEAMLPSQTHYCIFWVSRHMIGVVHSEKMGACKHNEYHIDMENKRCLST